jgi:hypothetical protein
MKSNIITALSVSTGINISKYLRVAIRAFEYLVARSYDSTDPPDATWLDIESIATVQVTSEQKDYLIEAAFGLHGKGWRAALDGTQTIRLIFDKPQHLSTSLASGLSSTMPKIHVAKNLPFAGLQIMDELSERLCASSGTLVRLIRRVRPNTTPSNYPALR